MSICDQVQDILRPLSGEYSVYIDNIGSQSKQFIELSINKMNSLGKCV